MHILITILIWIVCVLVGILLLSILSWGLIPAVFVKSAKLPAKALQGKHDDWWWFLHWVPRRLTALVNRKRDLGHNLGTRQYPVQLFGSNDKIIEGISIQDVPNPGQWCLCWPAHFAMLTNGGRLIAIGIRKTYWGDSADIRDGTDYWTFRLAFHKN